MGYTADKLDGSVNGYPDCVNEPGNISQGAVECPYWAKVGCYQTISSHYVGTDYDHKYAYRGCSAFHLKKSEDAEGNEEDNGFQCTDFQVDIGPPAGEVRYNT